MKNILLILFGVLFTQTACDLRPKVIAFPDSVGDFISSRYPALLADPDTQPEIYNSAAIDYGVYASPELYGRFNEQDYVMYASVDDYALLQQNQEIYEDRKKNLENVKKIDENVKSATKMPMYGGQSSDDFLVVQKPKISTVGSKRVALTDVTVASGDTLYSLSRKYSVPVNDLAVMNNLTSPFTLSVGQKIKVPDLTGVKTAKDVSGQAVDKSGTLVGKEKSVQQTAVRERTEEKISSDPSKKLPKINARSSSKFSWPVRGKILSDYGAKNNGLFNDGINISATKGTAVKAAENGVVAYAGNEVKGMGNLIIIQHDAGWMTVYAHMDSMNVKRGTKVNVGQKIGVVGDTGKVDEPQLHFEIRKGTKAYNPSNYMKK